jgi:hypothetical protein
MASDAITSNPMQDIPTKTNANTSKRLSRMLGLSLHSWEDIMVASLALAGVIALIIGIATFSVVRFQRVEIVESNEALERYKAEAANALESTKAEAARANESSERLKNETARLQSDNLALQTVMLPRHIALSSFSAPNNADTWFAPMAEFAAVPFVIQPTDDREARELASDIALALAFVGVRGRVDENATGLRPSQISEGVSVAYATGKPWTKENQPWLAWAKAADALADCLTKAGLGVGDAPVERYGFVPAGEADATMNFKPLREGVIVYVGQRPVSRTIAWIRSGRPNIMGPPSAATESNKQ